MLEVPIITEPRTTMPETSADIHRTLQELTTELLSIYLVHGERLRAAAPDVVLTQSLCAVCAVDESLVRDAVAEHLDRAVQVVSLSPTTWEEVRGDVVRIGVALGEEASAHPVADRMQEQLDGVTAEVADLDRPTVAVLEWLDPMMGAGNWTPELIRAAGGEPVLGAVGEHAPWTTIDGLAELDPDVIVITPCGFELARARAEAASLATQPGWSELRAVRTGRVAVADGHRFFNRPGPRLATSARILAEIVHPERVAPRTRGDAWEPLTGRVMA